MPFIPELFCARVLARIEERRNVRPEGVRFFDGLMTGEIDAFVGSFAVRGDGGGFAAIRLSDDVHVPASRLLHRRPRTESRVTPCTSR